MDIISGICMDIDLRFFVYWFEQCLVHQNEFANRIKQTHLVDCLS